MSTATQSPIDALQARLTAAQAEKAEAESAIGAVVLDGGDERAARKRVEDAAATVENLELAIVEQDGREKAAEIEDRKRVEAAARYRFVAWHLEHMRRLAVKVELDRKLKDAEDDLIALGSAFQGDVTGLGKYGDAPDALSTGAWVQREIQQGRLPDLRCYHNGPVVGSEQDRHVRRRQAEEAANAEPEKHVKLLEAELKKLGKSVDLRAISLPWAAK